MNNNVIYALTYNVSWATQANVALGSEKDFVEACQAKYKLGGKQCINNALKELKKLRYNFDIVALQEVNSNIENKFMKLFTNLDKYVKDKLGIETCIILWNSNKLGTLIKHIPVNLGKKNDDRACSIVLLKKDNIYNIIITLHAPNPYDNKKCSTGILKDCLKKHFKKYLLIPTTRLIILGDFNDHTATITSSNKLIFNLGNNNKISLSSYFPKKYHLKHLKTCCWHKRGHSWGYFIKNSDLIIANKNVKINKLFVPDVFNYKQRDKIMYSDHKPVIGELIFINNINNKIKKETTKKKKKLRNKLTKKK